MQVQSGFIWGSPIIIQAVQVTTGSGQRKQPTLEADPLKTEETNNKVTRLGTRNETQMLCAKPHTILHNILISMLKLVRHHLKSIHLYTMYSIAVCSFGHSLRLCKQLTLTEGYIKGSK